MPDNWGISYTMSTRATYFSPGYWPRTLGLKLEKFGSQIGPGLYTMYTWDQFGTIQFGKKQDNSYGQKILKNVITITQLKS